MKTYAIGAHELTTRHVLVGDSLCPTRYNTGAPVSMVDTDNPGMVLAVVNGRHVELLPNETVYVAR